MATSASLSQTLKAQKSESPKAPRTLSHMNDGLPVLTRKILDDINSDMAQELKYFIEKVNGDNLGWEPDMEDVARVLRSAAAVLISIGHADTVQDIWCKPIATRGYKDEFDFLGKQGHWYDMCRTSCVGCASTGNWEELMSHSLLRKTLVHMDDNLPESETLAVMSAWHQPYHGQAHEALWDHMHTHCEPNAFTRYAHHIVIVQSNGTGKSRMIDELAKKHFVIPINTRSTMSAEHGRHGLAHPPPDGAVLTWLTAQSESRENTHQRCCAFIQALFEHILYIIDNDLAAQSAQGIPNLSSAFRDKMQEGMQYGNYGGYHVRFFQDVISRATDNLKTNHYEYSSPSSNALVIAHRTTSQSHGESSEDWLFPPEIPCHKLMERLSSIATSRGAGSRTRHAVDAHYPLLTLAFDEAHTLTNIEVSNQDIRVKPVETRKWSVFSEIRSVLRSLKRQPVFAVFMATTGDVGKLATSRMQDPSSRILQGALSQIPSFSDLGLDQLARKISLEDGFDLSEVTSNEYMSHLGRPL
ncbi:uncharacterized protein B0H18DRAFT_1043513 [Fomitopsis serialis]|uniref:uncharacterized protein n=1 Tax=Fomitopsis serialis TaxID=139415 RepID=UPI002008DF16|nr:uncharacterized protein B0H18DRAFT_1043513 [Neoantrodia serialis]KAH9914972.1 hypothetical protein B0H18DRAFT_1043513 [Neoantrodia serialis]